MESWCRARAVVVAGVLALTSLTVLGVSGPVSVVSADASTIIDRFPDSRSISVGTAHTCVIARDGRLFCFGGNTGGELGLGDTASRGTEAGSMAALAAVDLGDGRTAAAVSAGFGHTCALLDDATLTCWGEGDSGELGNGSTETIGDEPGEMGDALEPIDLGGRVPVAVSAGHFFTCALFISGRWPVGATG